MKTTWKVDLAVLPNRLGERVELELSAPALEGLGNEFVCVKEDECLPLQVTLSNLSDGILLEVDGQVEASAKCVRCLEEFTVDLPFSVQEMLFTPQALATLKGQQNEADYEGADEDEDDPQGSFDMVVLREIPADNQIDVEELVRDEVGVQLPFRPLCEEDCPGLCPECGFVMREDLDHAHEVIDSRWSALAGLRDQLEQGKNGKK